LGGTEQHRGIHVGKDWEAARCGKNAEDDGIPFISASAHRIDVFDGNHVILLNMKTSYLLIALLAGLSSMAADCPIKDYKTGKRLLERDGDYVRSYLQSERLAKFDGRYLTDYRSGRRLYEMDGQYVKRYSDGRRVAELDGKYLKDYRTGTRVAELECPGVFSALAAAYYFF
jgi:hypothetical protein